MLKEPFGDTTGIFDECPPQEIVARQALLLRAGPNAEVLVVGEDGQMWLGRLPSQGKPGEVHRMRKFKVMGVTPGDLELESARVYVDINYTCAHPDVSPAIVEGWCAEAEQKYPKVTGLRDWAMKYYGFE